MQRCIFFILLTTAMHTASALPTGALQFQADALPWAKGVAPLPPIDIAILEGNPTNAGIYTFRINIPPQTKIPLHTHEKDERVTVIQGEICIGFDPKKPGNCIRAGGFYLNPKKMPHYLWTTAQGCIVQVTGEGPWGMQRLGGSTNGVYLEKQRILNYK